MSELVPVTAAGLPSTERRERMAQQARASKAKRTWRAYASDWQVWEVRPGRAVLGDAADRRDRGSDRRVAVAVDAAAHWRASGQPERRVRHERRVGVSAPEKM